MPRVLVYGIGNPGRRDDGLGTAAAQRVAGLGLGNVTCESNYQLNLEDAALCARHDIAIFIDAAMDIEEAFVLRPLEPDPNIPVMTHALTPEAVLAVSGAVFGSAPRAYVLGIRGHEWDQGEGLSPAAEQDLEAAIGFLERFLKELLEKA